MSNFGKGITVTSGFDLGAKTPLDSRLVVDNLSELEEHVKNNRVYDGMIVYVIKEQTTVQYVNKSWIPFGSDINQGVVIDNLNSILVNASLSANQGRVLREMIEAIKLNFYTTKEIDTIKEILEKKDAEILKKFDNISEYLPTKISYFDNDMNFITRGNLEEELRYIKIPVKTSDLINDAGYITQDNLEENVVNKIPFRTSDLINDAGYITQDNLEENVVNKIPIKTSQLENDSGYITQDNLAENVIDKIPIKTSQLENDMEYITAEEFKNLLEDADLSGLGNGKIHIGDKEPEEKDYLWVDTSTPSNLKVINHNERVKLKYIEMLSLVKTRLSNLSSKLNLIENNINKISSSNADKISIFKSILGKTRSQITILILQIENLISKETIEKEESKKIRKQLKTLLYSLSDFNDEVMRVLDSELKLDISGGDSDNDDDMQTDGASLLTEDGFVLLTEDGLMLLADGVATSTILADAILTELGLPILTENGKQILKG